jgi:hypothetical protein
MLNAYEYKIKKGKKIGKEKTYKNVRRNRNEMSSFI